jgi:xanthine dehydrogenase YagS FAD-binding subunit
MAVALAALDAVVTVEGPAGQRDIALDAFHRLPGETPQIETALAPGELITRVTLPPEGFAGRSIYRKVRDRASYAFALVSVAAVIDVAGGRIKAARLAFGGLAHKPWRVTEAEAKLVGAAPSAAAFTAAANTAFAGARGYGNNDFKVPLVHRTLHAVLAETTRA